MALHCPSHHLVHRTRWNPDLPCIVVRHTKIDAPMADKDAFYDELMEAADAECPAEELDAEHPLYILYTSGSTAKPKGILHTTGGYLTGVSATHRYVFDHKPDEARRHHANDHHEQGDCGHVQDLAEPEPSTGRQPQHAPPEVEMEAAIGRYARC